MSSLKSLFVIFLIALSLPLSSQEVNYNNFVNPFIGTDRMGQLHLFSHFSHDREHASPGYYSTFLDTYNIRSELTATNYKIKSIKLNGVPIVGSKLRHSEIMKGGVLEFEMYL